MLPIYEVEFIPAERRLMPRRSPQQQMARPPQGDRRQVPGRRKEDFDAASKTHTTQ